MFVTWVHFGVAIVCHIVEFYVLVIARLGCFTAPTMAAGHLAGSECVAGAFEAGCCP